jgi:hypothetical protein
MNTDNSHILYNFALKLGEVQEAGLVKELAKYRQDPRNLISKDLKFHITLHYCPLRELARENVFVEVKEFISSYSQISITFENPTILFDSADSLFVAYTVNAPELSQIHNKVIEIVKKYNNGFYNLKYDNPKYGYEERQLDLLHTYGYARVKEYFRPHLSVVKVSEKKTAEEILKTLPSKLDGQFTLSRFEILEIDDTSRTLLNIHIPINLREY